MSDKKEIAENRSNRAILSVALSFITGWGFAYLATNVFRDYSFGLFIWLPFVLGAVSTLLYGYRNKTSKRQLSNISMITLFIFCFGLLFFAWEGIVCMVMALPIGLLFTYIGHLIGYTLLKKNLTKTPVTILLLVLSVPALMAFENINKGKEKIRSVVTSIEINATPQEVWENVIAFPKLTTPTEFIFKTGIAYPVSATINAEGTGAVRYCNFSTGSFIEPITVWDEPRLLKFSVTEQPEPMKEISFYNIHPSHLHGYWVSKEGQFKLTPLANGRTRLEGTTWYVNKIKPGFYWTIWSDYIVHKIHDRVLKHIKLITETQKN